MVLNIYDSKLAVANKFSDYLEELVQNNAIVHIALSGGSTPRVVFDILADTKKDKIEWSKVHLYWGDERCVPPEDSESNYRMTKEHLLNKINIPSDNIHRIQGENIPANEAARYESILEKALPKENQIPQFNLVLLGMGDDGHTASIFPHQIELWDSERYCEVATHPDSGQQRITLTGKLINNARTVAFLVTGSDKANKVREIINKEKTSEAYPATLVAPVSGELFWFLDKEAAGKLTLD